MNSESLLKTITEHHLSVRRIPLQIISVHEGHHRDRHPNAEIILREVKRKIAGVWKTEQAEFIRVIKVPDNAGWWMCQSLSNHSSSQVAWSKKHNHLAPTLEESVQLFLDSLNK